ncbi:MAG: tol-pal system YbgF family protein [Winogradskyella sp.]|uniref:tetratricopeptide repeat protein n=1 Tax=Winogradskyella sp. TaxID=1883156 RepID=UPI00385DF6A9
MKNDELIALYFEGQLNADQSTRFNQLLQSDSAFKSQVMLEEQVKTAIISIKKDELHQKLKQLEQPKKTSKYLLVAIAASLVIALGIFSLLQPTNSVSNDALFAQYFKPYTNIIAPASRGDVTENKISEAFRYYDLKDYKTALIKFDSLYASTQKSYYLFYKAICQLQLGNTKNAIALFKTHQNYSDKLSEQTLWYLALAHLKTNNTKDAKRLLQTISTQKSYKYKSAEALLKKIR